MVRVSSAKISTGPRPVLFHTAKRVRFAYFDDIEGQCIGIGRQIMLIAGTLIAIILLLSIVNMRNEATMKPLI